MRRTVVSTDIISLPSSVLMSKQKHSRKTLITADALSPDRGPGMVPGTVHASPFTSLLYPVRQTGPADRHTVQIKGFGEPAEPALHSTQTVQLQLQSALLFCLQSLALAHCPRGRF